MQVLGQLLSIHPDSVLRETEHVLWSAYKHAYCIHVVYAYLLLSVLLWYQQRNVEELTRLV